MVMTFLSQVGTSSTTNNKNSIIASSFSEVIVQTGDRVLWNSTKPIRTDANQANRMYERLILRSRYTKNKEKGHRWVLVYKSLTLPSAQSKVGGVI